jgi:hypothetical protein
MGVAIRPRSEELERLARRCLGIASDVLQRDAGQTEAFDLASLEPLRVGETLREQHDLPGIEQRDLLRRGDQRRLSPVDPQHVPYRHPVERPIPRARGRVQVGVQVEVGDRDVVLRRPDPGNRPDPDHAVAAENEHRPITFTERVGDPIRGRLHDIQDRLEILRLRPRSVGSPGNDRRVAEIADVEAHAAERLDESARAECGRRLFLTTPAGAGS